MPTPEHLNEGCHHVPHDEGSTLQYQGHYGAPGIGYHTQCTECQQHFSVVGGSVYDPAEMKHIMTADDII